MNNHSSTSLVSELDELSDHSDLLQVGAFNVKGAVFLVPLDAPLPSEISNGELPSGSLYSRLAPLDLATSEGFSFVPVSGSELLALERSWRMLQTAKRVFVLTDLPAARYDVLFTQAVRMIGLQSIDWAKVSEAIASKVITDQRTKDKSPWVSPMIDGVELPPVKSKRGPQSSTGRNQALPIPEAEDEDQA